MAGAGAGVDVAGFAFAASFAGAGVALGGATTAMIFGFGGTYFAYFGNLSGMMETGVSIVASSKTSSTSCERMRMQP